MDGCPADMGECNRRLRRLPIEQNLETLLFVLRRASTQREVTRNRVKLCGAGSTSCLPSKTSLRPAHCSEPWILLIRSQQVKLYVDLLLTRDVIFLCGCTVTFGYSYRQTPNPKDRYSMRRTILLGSLMLALSAPVMAAQVYKWVDAQGVTHFGAQPPADTKAAAVDTKIAQPTPGFPVPAKAAPTLPPSTDEKQKAADEKVKQEVAQQEAERAKYCDSLRTNLAQLKNNPRVRVADDNGDMRRIPEEERQSRITETEHDLQQNCN